MMDRYPAKAFNQNRLVTEAELESGVPAVCDGCGSRESLLAINVRGHMTCCPERRMIHDPGRAGLAVRRPVALAVVEPSEDHSGAACAEKCAETYGRTDVVCREAERALESPRHVRCGLATCQEDEECAFPDRCCAVAGERGRAFDEGMKAVGAAVDQMAAFEGDPKLIDPARRAFSDGGDRPGDAVPVDIRTGFPIRATPENNRPGIHAPISASMVDPADPNEFNWRIEGRDHGYTAPDRRVWWKRLPLIRHICAVWLSWQVHNYAGAWAEVGIGVGGPNPHDLWVVEGAWHGYW
jgi:hypothetical protein